MSQETLKRHKWADVAVAFAEGKEIQYKAQGRSTWEDWSQIGVFPSFSVDGWSYRIKPEPKPDRVRYYPLHDQGHSDLEAVDANFPESVGVIAVTFDGETGKPKEAKIVS